MQHRRRAAGAQRCAGIAPVAPVVGESKLRSERDVDLHDRLPGRSPKPDSTGSLLGWGRSRLR